MNETAVLLGLAFDDGTTGGKYSGEVIRDAMADSWDSANAEISGDIEWITETDDDPDLQVSISPAMLAELWRKSREYDRIMSLCVHAPRCECE